MRYGLGQTSTSIVESYLSPLPNYISIKLADGGTLNRYADNSFEIYGGDNSYYYQDKTGYWNTIDSNGFKCWGDAFSGAWKCQDGSAGGNWATSPAAPIKQKAKTTAATLPVTLPTTTLPATPMAAPPAAPAPAPAAQAPSVPPPAQDPNDQIVSREGPDAAGGMTYYYASNASYYVLPDGTWHYTDAYGNQYDGDASGGYCDSFGNCTGPWAPGGQPGQPGGGPLFGSSTAIILGAVIVVLAISFSGRK